MSGFWSWFIIVLTVVNIAACWWLIRWTTKPRPGEVGEHEVIDHVWDGDLQERNNPMPRWWLILFYLTIVYAVGYLIVYPGLGKVSGVFGWSSVGQYEAEVEQANALYGQVFAKFADQDIEALANNAEAVALGRNLFVNNCATCHGSDAQGAIGFPNLSDGDWLYGGDPAAIVHSIAKGRASVMPPLGAALGDQGVDEVVAYVRSLSGLDASAELASAGQARYMTLCVACHGPEGKGNTLLGAPNLADDIWLHGSSAEVIRATVMNGRQGMMPAHDVLLSDDKIRVVAAYVYSLSQGGGAAGSR